MNGLIFAQEISYREKALSILWVSKEAFSMKCRSRHPSLRPTLLEKRMTLMSFDGYKNDIIEYE